MDELIWKQDAIDAMLGDKVEITNVIRAIGNVRDFEVLNTTCDRHAEIIKALPPVQPKHGKWHIENNSYVVLDVCDQCMRSVRHVAPFYDFCPHCGADMRSRDVTDV